MQTEKFYSKIRENLENSDFTPEWNKEEVWQRIEPKDRRKALSVWWKTAAAGIVLASLMGGYLLFDNKATVADSTPVKKSLTPKSTQPVLGETITTPEAEENEEQMAKAQVSHPVHKKNAQPAQMVENAPVAGNEIAKEEFENMVTTEGGEQEFSYNNITSRNEPAIARPVMFDAPIIFRPAKTADKPAPVPARRERVAILEIPEDQEDYVIAPKEKKKNRQARLAKQVEKTPEATDPNKPNKIWAFVKQSFKNETMPADSTIK